MAIVVEKWGLKAYDEAWKAQEERFNQVIEGKQQHHAVPNRLIVCEHPPVYTLGRSGQLANLLRPQSELIKQGVSFYKIDRGGDITYHGPGQLVAYPILNLEEFGIGLKQYIFLLEEAVSEVCMHFNIPTIRLSGATGVWLPATVGRPLRKICAIGVRCSHFVTMHGLALNVNTQLSYFNAINPCGFTDKGVTSMEQELGHAVPFETVQDELITALLEQLNKALHNKSVG